MGREGQVVSWSEERSGVYGVPKFNVRRDATLACGKVQHFILILGSLLQLSQHRFSRVERPS